MWRSLTVRNAFARTTSQIVSHKPCIQSKYFDNPYSTLLQQTNSILFNQTAFRFQSNQSSNTNTSANNFSKLPKFEKPVPKKQSKFYSFLSVFASGVVAFVAISYYLEYRNKNNKEKPVSINYESNYLPGKVKPAKSIKHEGKNPGNVKLTLYQYVTCPFCCKVRAYLDYFGYNYDIVEVNSISKDQLDWSTYKKVPVVVVQIPTIDNPDVYEKEIIQLNDSSQIVSALETFRLDSSHSLKEIIRYFQPVEFDSKSDNIPLDMNKYFIMLYNDNVSDRKSLVDRKSEREWRTWVDQKFVHVISPNIYRTFSEALDSFKWFDRAGDWENHFTSFQRSLIIYLGSAVMYLLGKRLKYKYELKDDVRISLYDLCDEWVSSFSEGEVFKGGSVPNLADLALYGCMGSFEGCAAFEDMMRNSKIKNWYEACREQVTNSKGHVYLNNPKCFNPNFNKKNDLNYDEDCKNNKKSKKRFGLF